MSTALDAMLAGRIYEDGRAIRRTTLRHTHLAERPLGIAVWRLGGERFRAAAVAWGPVGEPFELAVAGEPRNRDLYFDALIPFALRLCAQVRAAAVRRTRRERGSWAEDVPDDALQIVVPNRTTVGALGLLGRYLGYLSDRSGTAPDPALTEVGRHLRFYTRHARMPGQSLIVPLDRLVGEHWATLLSPFEQANLAALDAQIEPDGIHAFDAAAAAEAAARIGPEPTEDVDRITDDLLEAFNTARDGSTDPAVVTPLLGPLQAHYRRLVEPVWELMARMVERERQLRAAPSVTRRFEADREAYGRHVDWVIGGGYYRTTDTPRQAAMTLRRLEDAQQRYEAEKAVDDPACMVPHLLDGDAIRGTVVSVDDKNRVVEKVRRVRRPLMVLAADDPVSLPTGKELWWTATAHDKPWRVTLVQPDAAGGGSLVVLQLTISPNPERLPQVGDHITLSVLRTSSPGFWRPPPQDPPWTHEPATPPDLPEPIDAGDAEPPTAAVDAAQVENPERFG